MLQVTHKPHRLWLAAALVAALTVPGLAQQGEPVLEESLIRWQFFQEIEPPAADGGRWYDLVIPNSVFDTARFDLADLRVYDATDREVPYALRVLQRHSSEVPAETKQFNMAVVDGNVRELTLDLTRDDIEHNEVIIETRGNQFRRKVLLEGSDDAREWRKIKEQRLLRFHIDDHFLEKKAMEYPPVRFRYLRLSVSPDPDIDRDPVEIVKVRVQHRVEIPGEYVTQQGTLERREGVRTRSGDGSAWFVDLGGDEIPCEEIEVDVADADFVRSYEIQQGGPVSSRETLRTVTRGEWRRRAGQEVKPLVARFSEIRASRLRIVVTDYRNQPLTIEAVRYVAPVRQLVIAADTQSRGPLRLFFGNPNAEAPNYDFAGNLPAKLDPQPMRADFGPREANPAYAPKPLPLTERLPWLIYVVLGAIILVLAVLILSVARAAIAAHDQQPTTVTETG